MINLTQIILVLVITTLTVLLTFIGIQVIYILKDLRLTLRRINKIADNAEVISSAVVKPVTGISTLVEGIQSSVKIAELLSSLKRGGKKIAEEIPDKIEEFKENVEEMKESEPRVWDNPPKYFHH